MPDFRKLIIEAQIEKHQLPIINPVLANLKDHFSRRCSISESCQVDELSGAVSICISIEGDMLFLDLEANNLNIIALNNLGCRILYFDLSEKPIQIRHTKGALLYANHETPPDSTGPRPSAAGGEISRMNGNTGSSWNGLGTLCLMVLLAVFAYKFLASPAPDTEPKPAPATVSSQPPAGPSEQHNARQGGTSTPSPTQSHTVEVPPLKVPRLGIPAGNAKMLNKRVYDQLEKIVREYRLSHTYSTLDLFVCADMAIDVWNILKTKKINARIMAGRVDEDITRLPDLEYIGQINHAWVVAEPEAGMPLPLETTGGFVITPDKPKYALYLEGLDFGNPRSFKEFVDLRSRTFDTCRQVKELQDHYNEAFAGKPITKDSLAYKGRLDQKVQDCIGAVSQMNDLLLRRN